MIMDIEKAAYEKAVDVLEKCSTEHGFYAAFPGYDMVFARDSMIMSLGASLIGERFKKVIVASLKTLADNQSPKGQVANAVDKWSVRGKRVDFKSIDSTLWFLIGLKNYEKKFGKLNLEENAKRARTWLLYQDFCENGSIVQLPTTDWQDAFPHRYGMTLNSQALYYEVLNLYEKKKEAERLRKLVNENLNDGLWNGDFYLSWRWKNHNAYKEKGEWFDTFGNLLAIVYGLADSRRSKKILEYISSKKINFPWPMKTMFPPLKKGDKDWQDYFEDCDAREPWHYLNGGIWTFIGGFYVCTLVKMGEMKEAKEQLLRLAEANLLKPEFSEWLDGKTGKVGRSSADGNDGGQGWNASMYIAAYESVQKGRCLI